MAVVVGRLVIVRHVRGLRLVRRRSGRRVVIFQVLMDECVRHCPARLGERDYQQDPSPPTTNRGHHCRVGYSLPVPEHTPGRTLLQEAALRSSIGHPTCAAFACAVRFQTRYGFGPSTTRVGALLWTGCPRASSRRRSSARSASPTRQANTRLCSAFRSDGVDSRERVSSPTPRTSARVD